MIYAQFELTKHLADQDFLPADELATAKPK